MFYGLILIQLFRVTCFQYSQKYKRNLKFTIQNSFHLTGDLSGDYQLSGLWKIDTHHINKQILPFQPSWSGNSWMSHYRKKMVSISEYIVLDSEGSFSTPMMMIGEKVYGKWFCDGPELTLVRFGYAYNVIETYTGLYRPDKSHIKGYIAHGISEPDYSGHFKMTHLMPSINPIIQNVKLNRKTTLFQSEDIVGNWEMTFKGENAISAYTITLYMNNTWQTTSYLGIDNAKLAGTWNLFDENIDLTSGIKGSGSKIWLWMRRFGHSNAITTGMHLEQDRLYIGNIQSSSLYNKTQALPKNIEGKVAIGWSTEPTFIGTFNMRPTLEKLFIDTKIL